MSLLEKQIRMRSLDCTWAEPEIEVPQYEAAWNVSPPLPSTSLASGHGAVPPQPKVPQPPSYPPPWANAPLPAAPRPGVPVGGLSSKAASIVAKAGGVEGTAAPALPEGTAGVETAAAAAPEGTAGDQTAAPPVPDGTAVVAKAAPAVPEETAEVAEATPADPADTGVEKAAAAALEGTANDQQEKANLVLCQSDENNIEPIFHVSVFSVKKSNATPLEIAIFLLAWDSWGGFLFAHF